MAKISLHSPFLTLSISILLLLLLPIVFSQSNSSISKGTQLSTICNSTLYPSLCIAVLNGSINSSTPIRSYTCISLDKSLSSAQKFLALNRRYLRRHKNLTTIVARALQDCEFLAQCNVDNLNNSYQTIDQNINSSPHMLPELKFDDVQTILSAILTNTQTCIDGLQSNAFAWGASARIVNQLANDTQLYSVSLDLFTNRWLRYRKTRRPQHPSGFFAGAYKRKQLKSSDGRFKLRMSEKNMRIFQTATNRKLLQAADNEIGQVNVSDIIIVDQNGNGNFSTINDALAVAPNNTNRSNGYFLIYIKAGVYEEYVSVPKNKKYLMMIGDGINQTIITGNRSVVDGWTTFNSATFAVVAPNFIASDITFRNTAGPIKHQAVAVRNGADFSIFYQCSIEAYQDTLYAHSLRQFYSDCLIYGTVDFIFGNAAVVFQGCNLRPRLPMPGQFNAITAQGRIDPNQNTGISIQNCTIQAAEDLAANNAIVKTYLGRPWKEYSRTVYMQSFMDGSIDPTGWSPWLGDFALNTSYYAEFNNTGPGSNTSARVTWPGFHVINQTDAGNFTVSAFLLGDDWIPPSGVAYEGGL
ncbi:Probable pectinesterase/pectinesterase inhibitor 7 [Striga hermonthica]|uniref:Pectinesterase n=1 Tax=Striga hermonthica TaxID=68872 RepID=A0A9N7N725_STRHE|nr:Probable pectinesterase/pectinesterase inhibitor 7 [Striga hermonthica]